MNLFVLRHGTLAFLKSRQNKDGSFVSKTSESLDFVRASDSDTIFLNSLILSSLASIPETHELKKIKQKALAFLLSQKSAHWSFNYWKKESDKAKTMPYSDDLDDTFCALSAIFQTDPKVLDAEALAKIVTLLTAVEEKEGGPYYTWIVPPDADKAWRDVDLAVNSNVAYFLAQQDIFLSNLREFICGKIEKKEVSSKYYPDIFPVTYFMSRYLALDKKVSPETKRKLAHFILLKRQKNGSWGDVLHTSLAVSSMLWLGTEPSTLTKSVEFLKKEILQGNWQASAFCCDPVVNKKQYYAGSSALTAAFCLEAIQLYENSQFSKPNLQTYAKPKSPSVQNKTYRKVVEKARERFSKLDIDLRKEALLVFSRTLKSDKDKQIILMPLYFAQSLNKNLNSKLLIHNSDLLIRLGEANLYGWMAYRIYDDFFDGEGKPVHLSVANVCLRELTTIYNGIIPEKFQEIMDVLDSANAWEVAHTRFDPKQYPPQNIPDYGDYSQLAEKSLGHALGPLAVLAEIGYELNSKEVKQFLSFFRHYIIARQLNDDAHDWEKDLARGQINAVGAMVLKKLKVKNDPLRREARKLKIDSKKLREVFWQEVIQEACPTILQHIQEAKTILDKNSFIKNKSTLLSLLAPIEKSAQIALAEQKEALEFMSEYGK